MHDSIAAPRRPAVGALLTALTAGALLMGLPAATLAAQGDNEVVISVVDTASPAVVTIQSSADLQVLPDGLELPQAPGTEGDEGPQFQLPELPDFGAVGTGSGVIIDPEGLILTNRHVVGDAETVDVILADGRVLEGKVVGADTLTDFAFVDVEATDLPTVPLGESDALRIGQLAVAIGNPLGQFAGSASVGIVSGLDRSLDVGFGMSGTGLRHLIQTDAAINPGNSGGALLDGDGKLIGISTAQAGFADGIGFALPIDLAKPIIDQALAGEPLARPWIGVVYRAIDPQVAADEELPVEAGAWVTGGPDEATGPVMADSPAAAAGIIDGDIITAISGVSVDATNPLDLLILGHQPDETVTISVLRDGQTLDLEATLGTRPADLEG